MNGRAITHRDDEDEEEDLFNIVGADNKSKNKTLKRKHSSTLSKAPSASPAIQYKFQVTEIIDIDGDSNVSKVAEDERVRLEIARLAQQRSSSSSSAPTASTQRPSQQNEIVLLDDDDIADSARDKEYLAVMQRINSITQVSRSIDLTTSSAPVSTKAQASSTTPMFKSYTIPQVMTAEQRKKAADEKYAREQAIIAENQPIVIHSSRKTKEESDDDEDGDFPVKTRLSTDEKRWNIYSDKPLAKLRKKLCQLYQIQPNQIKITFDGEDVADSATPESLALEEDDLLELKISDKAILQKALLAVGIQPKK